jgi:Ca2+-binding EF-hand superfamily protein
MNAIELEENEYNTNDENQQLNPQRELNLNNKSLTNETLISILSQVENINNITHINLSSNNITSLDSEQLLSQYINVIHIDLTSNPIQQQLHELCYYLLNLPSLISLNIDITSTNEIKTIIHSLPNLLYLNGEQIQKEMLSHLSFNDELNTNISSIIQQLVIYIKTDIKLLTTLNSNLSHLLHKAKNSINFHKNQNSNSYILSIYQFQYLIYDYLYTFIYENIYPKPKTYLMQNDQDLKELIAIIKQLKEHNHNMIINHSFGNIVMNNKLIVQFNNLVNNKDEIIEQLITESNIKENEVNKIKNENKSYQNEHQFLYENIQKTKEENTILTSKLFSKVNELCDPNEPQFNTSSLYQLSNSTNPQYNTNLSSSSKHKTPKIVHSLTPHHSSKVKPNPTSLNKLLSLNMLLYLINDIYKSKRTQDSKNISLNVPQETLEQHLYTFLNHKYGLKTIIIEKAYVIINSVKKYSTLNSEVCLFAKILRNEIDEGSIEIIDKLKQSLYSTVCYYKQVTNIDNVEKLEIDDELQVFICKNVFQNSKQETDMLMNKVNGVKEKQGTLTYKDLFNCILEIHIIVRSGYLKRFREMFGKYDQEGKGVLNAEELEKLYGDIYERVIKNNRGLISKQEFVEYLIKKGDSKGIGTVTFSNCVILLEEYDKNLDVGKSGLSIIDILAME